MCDKKRPSKISAIFDRCYNSCALTLTALTECEITDCLLYHYRTGEDPFRGKVRPKDVKSPSKAIKAYCLHYCCNGISEERKECPVTTCPLWNDRK